MRWPRGSRGSAARSRPAACRRGRRSRSTNYNVSSWNAIAAPAGTPPAVIERLNRAIREAIASPALVDKLQKTGMRLQAGSPEQAQALLAGDIRRWTDVIRKAKIEVE